MIFFRIVWEGDFLNERKRHVMKVAHQLFVEKGFQATSVQDIIDESGISKGTFYNYFSSKNELLISIFQDIFTKVVQGRNEILIGNDCSDIELFIKQIEYQLELNQKSKLFELINEVMITNDPELKQFLKKSQLKMVNWTFERFVEIFGEEQKHYLLDCAIMFMGILDANIKYYFFGHGMVNIRKIVRYSVKRIEGIIHELAQSNDAPLNEVEVLKKWFPNESEDNFAIEFNEVVLELKKKICQHSERKKYEELLDFIQEELIQGKSPRQFVIYSAVRTLQAESSLFSQQLLNKLEKLLNDFFIERQNKTTF